MIHREHLHAEIARRPTVEQLTLLTEVICRGRDATTAVSAMIAIASTMAQHLKPSAQQEIVEVMVHEVADLNGGVELLRSVQIAIR